MTLTFKSSWDIEWDFDYGFVLDRRPTAARPTRRYPSANGYTTDRRRQNPNAERLPGAVRQRPDRHERLVRGGHADGRPRRRQLPRTPAFVDDSYDISDLAGKPTPCCASATRPTRASPGRAGSSTTSRSRPATSVIYSTDFETSADDPRSSTAAAARRPATAQTLHARLAVRRRPTQASPADHAYYMEMRDRSGFDVDGHGQTDRGADRVRARHSARLHRRGPRLRQRRHRRPAGADARSTRSPSRAATRRTSTTRRSQRRATRSPTRGAGHVDNYTDPTADGNWTLKYDCLTFDGRQAQPATASGRRSSRACDLHGDVTFTLGTAAARSTTATGAVGPGVPEAPPQAYPSQERKPTAATAPAAAPKPAPAAAKANGTSGVPRELPAVRSRSGAGERRRPRRASRRRSP